MPRGLPSDLLMEIVFYVLSGKVFQYFFKIDISTADAAFIAELAVFP